MIAQGTRFLVEVLRHERYKKKQHSFPIEPSVKIET